MFTPVHSMEAAVISQPHVPTIAERMPLLAAQATSGRTDIFRMGERHTCMHAYTEGV
jgi:hypothetical protein